jgi:hypothetical protein
MKSIIFQARWEQKKWQNNIELVVSQMEKEKSPEG